MKLFFLSTLAALVVSDPKMYIVDIDSPASVRWGAVCEDYKDTILKVLPTVLEMIPADLLPLAKEEAMYYYDNFMPQEPYKNDIEYLSECTGLNLTDAVTVNMAHSNVPQKSNPHVHPHPSRNSPGTSSCLAELQRIGSQLEHHGQYSAPNQRAPSPGDSLLTIRAPSVPCHVRSFCA